MKTCVTSTGLIYLGTIKGVCVTNVLEDVICGAYHQCHAMRALPYSRWSVFAASGGGGGGGYCAGGGSSEGGRNVRRGDQLCRAQRTGKLFDGVIGN